MTSVRLLMVAFLLYSVAGLCQEQAQTSSNAPVSAIPQSKAPEQLSEPWRIIPPELNFSQNPQIEPQFGRPIVSPDDFVCLKIRSYVVARDSKDSDSVHLVKYSTCQPANRYRLKTTVIQERDHPRDPQ